MKKQKQNEKKVREIKAANDEKKMEKDLRIKTNIKANQQEFKDKIQQLNAKFDQRS